MSNISSAAINGQQFQESETSGDDHLARKMPLLVKGSTQAMSLKQLRAVADLYRIPNISTTSRERLVELLVPYLEGRDPYEDFSTEELRQRICALEIINQRQFDRLEQFADVSSELQKNLLIAIHALSDSLKRVDTALDAVERFMDEDSI